MRLCFCAATVAVVGSAHVFAGSYGIATSNYVPGTTGSTNFNNNPSAATGLPDPNGDPYYGTLTPFNPVYAASQVLVLGAGGSITLQLSAPVSVGPSAFLGVFDNTGIADEDPDSDFDKDFNYTAGGRGLAGTPAFDFGGGTAKVSVSANGQDFIPLSAAAFTFHTPTNGYTDNSINLGMGAIGTHPADFFKPFTHTLSDFGGKWYSMANTGPTILDLLNGSAGGTWLSLSGVPLSQIEYVRFDVPTGSRLALDAITAVPEPAALFSLLTGALLLRRRR